MSQLPVELQEKIDLLSAQGDAFDIAGDIDSALARYGAALALVPAPQIDWQGSGQILFKIGTLYFLDGQFQAGSDALRVALACPSDSANARVHLRLGQVELELDNRAVAIEHLTRAYELEGVEIFDEEDPKYLAFLKKVRPALVQ